MSALKKPNLESVTTINRDGSRLFLHPSNVRGFFSRWRKVVAAVLLVIYVLLPWIPINNHPAAFFDIASRRFHFFGLTFLPQDLWVFFFLLTGLGFTLFFVTAVLGRVWCGWYCPYTVFLEHLYRRIERWIDGDAAARRRLDKAPWTGSKITKRVVKHVIYFLISAALAHVFLSYFVSVPRLYEIMRTSPMENVKSFGVVVFLTGAFYFCFSWFREQFCIILCPYGRIQSALTDDNTLVIGYDEGRGEPRGSAKDPSNGDCVNCFRCVQVCPTGIDIRNGLQMECIGCANCIDACNEVMTRLDRPKGLVRYDSLNGLKGGKTRIIRPRTILYTGFTVLGAVALVLTVMVKLRPIEALVTRMPGQPYYLAEASVRNQYRIRLATKRNEETRFQLRIVGAPDGTQSQGVEDTIVLQSQGEVVRPFFVSIPYESYQGSQEIEIEIRAEPGGSTLKQRFEFLGPSQYVLAQEREAAATQEGSEVDEAGGSGNEAKQESEE